MTASVRVGVGDLAARELDLLVIGGGITGAGILRDAAMRGLRAALVDQADFGAGTSSRSSRLIHGGLRYLEHRQWRLVFEALQERAILLRLAPHLVRPLAFVCPVYRGDRVPRWKLALGLALYGLLAAGGNVPRPRIFGKAGILALEPNLRVLGLTGGGVYHDAQCDDARLVIATIRAAVRHGALAFNYATVTALVTAEGRVQGAEVIAGPERREGPAGRSTVRARCIVNATGPWTDRVRQLEDSAATPILRLTRGSHIVVRRSRLGHTRGITFTSAVDGRVMFVLPLGDHSYVGTTDTDFGGDPADVRLTREDTEYLLRSVNALFPHARLAPEDVITGWAGVRPLLAADPGAHPDEVPREHRIVTGPKGLITVTGGKLTTYRRMAAEVVDQVFAALGAEPATGPTETEPLVGGESPAWDSFRQGGIDLGLSDATMEHLIAHFGTEAAAIVNLVRTDRSLMARIHPDHPAIAAEILHAVRREMALTVDDMLSRRLHLSTETADRGTAAAGRVAELMARELAWTGEEAGDRARHYIDAQSRNNVLEIPSPSP